MVFLFRFTVSLIPSINTFEFSNDFLILIISFISSFEINKVNPFLALTIRFPLIFLSSLFIAFEAKLLTNPGKRTATFVSAFLPKLAKQEQPLIELF